MPTSIYTGIKKAGHSAPGGGDTIFDLPALRLTAHKKAVWMLRAGVGSL